MKGNLSHYSSIALTCLSAIGVIGTAVLAVKETPKAVKLVETATDEKGEQLTTAETVKAAAPAYIPAALAGVGTIACIFGANALNVKQQASLVSAYALVDNLYKEYRKKTREIAGEDTETQIRESMVRESIDENYISNDESTCLFYDMNTGSYFESPIDLVQFDDGLECYVIHVNPPLS